MKATQNKIKNFFNIHITFFIKVTPQNCSLDKVPTLSIWATLCEQKNNSSLLTVVLSKISAAITQKTTARNLKYTSNKIKNIKIVIKLIL